MAKAVVKPETVKPLLASVCPHCGSSRIEKTEVLVKCLDCGMGKYLSGRR